MARIYVALIQKGLKTIDDVPEKLKAAVQAILDEANSTSETTTK